MISLYIIIIHEYLITVQENNYMISSSIKLKSGDI